MPSARCASPFEHQSPQWRLTLGNIENNYLLTLLNSASALLPTVLLLLHFVVSVERHNSDGHAVASRPRSR